MTAVSIAHLTRIYSSYKQRVKVREESGKAQNNPDAAFKVTHCEVVGQD